MWSGNISNHAAVMHTALSKYVNTEQAWSVFFILNFYVVAEYFCLSPGGLSTKFGQVGDC